MRLRELGEFRFIKEVSKGFRYDDDQGIIKGIGDDASVTVIDERRYLLATTDTLMEGVHFSLDYTSPFVLGRKSVAVSLSDIAAMGGVPRYLLLSIGIPDREGIDMGFMRLFYKGVKEMADSYDVRLVGGNTSYSKDKLFISGTMIGEVEKDRVVFRTGARAGDEIFVTGQLGDSALGLSLWKKKDVAPVTDPFYREAMLRHIDPVPRVREGQEIARRGLATSMIDISDGLIGDLGHILDGCNLGARIYLSQLPLSRALKRHLQEDPSAISLPLAGGEDYELLFTSDPSNGRGIKRLSEELELPITPIGEITTEVEGVVVIDVDGKPINIKERGYDHFLSVI